MVVALTGSARIQASKAGLEDVLSGLKLSAACQSGDVISVSAGGDSHDFSVLRRRWIVGDGGHLLEITLDYPVRGR